MTAIGRYQIRKELGRGAMGIVYLADDPAIGRQVAIKTIRLDQLSQPGDELLLRRRLFREAHSAGRLSHPGVITIYDFAEADGVARIVMEYVEGETLHRRIERHACRLPRALDMLEQIARALDYAHSRGVLHCDIKPENLIISRDGKVKVMDFGISRVVSEATMLNGMVLGTPSYMSPEQVSGQALTGATDQYSMAVVGFELLSGAKPFEGSSLPDLLRRIAYEEPAIERLGPNVPPCAINILKKALSKDPAGRYRTCTEMIAALRAACKERPCAEPLPARRFRDEPVTADASSRRLWPALGACTAILLAGVLALSVSHFRKPEPVSWPGAIGRPAEPVRTRPSPALPARTAREWSVAVATIPSGAVVSARGRYCVSPCRLQFPPGDHYVTAKFPGFQTQYRLVRVPKQSSLQVELPLSSGR